MKNVTCSFSLSIENYIPLYDFADFSFFVGGFSFLKSNFFKAKQLNFNLSWGVNTLIRNQQLSKQPNDKFFKKRGRLKKGLKALFFFRYFKL